MAASSVGCALGIVRRSLFILLLHRADFLFSIFVCSLRVATYMQGGP